MCARLPGIRGMWGLGRIWMEDLGGRKFRRRFQVAGRCRGLRSFWARRVLVRRMCRGLWGGIGCDSSKRTCRSMPTSTCTWHPRRCPAQPDLHAAEALGVEARGEHQYDFVHRVVPVAVAAAAVEVAGRVVDGGADFVLAADSLEGEGDDQIAELGAQAN